MPTILATKTITVRWFRDSEETHTRKEQYDSAEYESRWSEYPKKQALPDPMTNYVESVAVHGEIMMMDTPKNPIRHNTTLVDVDGTTYRILDTRGFTEFGIAYYKLYVCEYTEEYPR